MLSVVKYKDQIAQIAIDVFRSMLGMEVDTCEKPAPLISDVTALVNFGGYWSRALLIQCSFNQAFEFTSRLMGMEPPTSFNEDALDTMGEVANMVGGNLKALLMPKGTLSVPEVFSMMPTSTWIPEDFTVSKIALKGEMGVFFITLMEQFPSEGSDSEVLVGEEVNG